MQVANMGFTTILKTVMVLGWLYAAEAQSNSAIRPVIFPGDSNVGGQPIQNVQQFSNNQQFANNRQSEISQKPRCTNNLGDESAPCLNDEDYNDSVSARFRHLLTRFRGSNIVRNDFFRTLTTPEKIASPQPNDGIRDPFEYDPLCASEETIIFPKRAKTRSNDWVFVLNQGKRKQAVKVEKCRNNNRACNLGAARTEVNSVCRQKYIYKKLLVMNGDGTDIVPESVLMPSCCVCYIKSEIQSFTEDDIFHFARKKNETLGMDLMDSDSVQEISTTEESTLAPSTDKDKPINFQNED